MYGAFLLRRAWSAATAFLRAEARLVCVGAPYLAGMCATGRETSVALTILNSPDREAARPIVRSLACRWNPQLWVTRVD